MILDFTDSVIANTTHPLIGDTSYLTRDPFVLVQSAEVHDSGPSPGNCRFVSRLSKRLVMEQKWSLIPAISVVGPAYVIEDPDSLVQEGTNGLLKYAFSMRPPNDWSQSGFEWDEV